MHRVKGCKLIVKTIEINLQTTIIQAKRVISYTFKGADIFNHLICWKLQVMFWSFINLCRMNLINISWKSWFLLFRLHYFKSIISNIIGHQVHIPWNWYPHGLLTWINHVILKCIIMQESIFKIWIFPLEWRRWENYSYFFCLILEPFQTFDLELVGTKVESGRLWCECSTELQV